MSRKSILLNPLMWLVLVIWFLVLIALSISPISFKLKLHTMGRYHDMGHYLVYLATALLICQVAKRFTARVIGFFFAVGIAVGQEWLENEMYHAGFEWRDVITDLAGIMTGFALVTLVTVLFSDPETSRRFH